MKTILKFTPSILGMSLTGYLLAQEPQRPNIIYVFPDQLRNCALNFWGDADFKKQLILNQILRIRLTLINLHVNR